MEIVKVHLGKEVPKHVIVGLENTINNFSGRVKIIVEDENLSKFIGYKAEILPLSRYSSHPIVKQFREVNGLEEGFWTHAALRLFVLQAYMDSEDCTSKSIIHLENDVLIYDDPMKYSVQFENLYKDKIAVNPIGEDYLTFAYTYIDNLFPLKKINEEYIELVSQNTISFLNELTNHAGLNEMTLMNLVYKSYPDLFGFLPILPEGEFSKGYQELGAIFDCASWGQYLGGTPGVNNVGWRGVHHYIGREIDANKYIPLQVLEYPQHKADKKYAVVKKETNELFPLHCLHIHSKELEKFL